MNINLPEKEKLKKKTIIIYTTSILICILSIAVVVCLQILGNDIVNNFFGVNKIVKKTEEEENELKSNFDNLFNNQLELRESYSVHKINEDKEIIYTSFSYTEQTSDYELDIHIPYVNIKNKTAQNYNNQISEIFEDKANTIIESKSKNTIYTVKYQAYLENNILSLVIYSELKQSSSPQRVVIQTFNFNLDNSKQLSLEDMIDIYGLDKNYVQNKITDEIKKAEEKSKDLQNLGYNVFSRDVKSDIYNIENSNEFFVHNNNLYIIYAYGNDSLTSEMDLVVI